MPKTFFFSICTHSSQIFLGKIGLILTQSQDHNILKYVYFQYNYLAWLMGVDYFCDPMYTLRSSGYTLSGMYIDFFKLFLNPLTADI